mmetsp:Transcript_5023/g.17101  ORF Transcript_5023/g.17101 Transcript_5023/m.17101 type:complete len:289 (-) Transcript_5023:54-920(-)
MNPRAVIVALALAVSSTSGFVSSEADSAVDHVASVPAAEAFEGRELVEGCPQGKAGKKCRKEEEKKRKDSCKRNCPKGKAGKECKKNCGELDLGVMPPPPSCEEAGSIIADLSKTLCGRFGGDAGEVEELREKVKALEEHLEDVEHDLEMAERRIRNLDDHLGYCKEDLEYAWEQWAECWDEHDDDWHGDDDDDWFSYSYEYHFKEDTRVSKPEQHHGPGHAGGGPPHLGGGAGAFGGKGRGGGKGKGKGKGGAKGKGGKGKGGRGGKGGGRGGGGKGRGKGRGSSWY